MKLNQLIAGLRRFNKIMITGPQRSGTTIATKIIASELNYPAKYEEDLPENSLDSFFKMHYSNENYVLQGTGLTYICDKLPLDAVVYILRDVSEIEISIERVNWMPYNKYECRRYFRNDDEKSWEIKNWAWDNYQKQNIKNWFELDYYALRSHSLWREERKHFTERQTQ